jgi:predicted MPP superfamily phosphohydrolase
MIPSAWLLDGVSVVFFGVLTAAVVAWTLRPDGRLLTAVLLGSLAALALPAGIVLVEGDVFAASRVAAWLAFVFGPLVLGFVAWRTRGAVRIVAGATVAALLAIAVDAFLVEPRLLFVNEHVVVSDEVDEPFRVAVLADLQTDAPGWHTRSAVRAAVDAEPDLILLPGDFVQIYTPDGHRRAVDALRAIFEEEGLQAPVGVVAVRGNVEIGGWERTLFGGTSVLASDASVRRVLGTGEPGAPRITVTALSLRDGFDPTLRVPPGEGLHIVVGHAPDFALGDIRADLLIAGHTHGGQVRLPIVGPLLTFSQVPSAWAAGRTDLGSGATLVVSRGVGMERESAPRLRFLCPPEVVIVDVVPR